MSSFYNVTIIIALVILIIILIILAIIMSFKNKSLKYPPSYGNCPDYWSYNADNKSCRIPTVTAGVPGLNGVLPASISTTDTPGYNSSSTHIDFNNQSWNNLYSTKSKQCALKKWTNDKKVEWDGISNYNDC
jgi:hypothetical protein